MGAETWAFIDEYGNPNLAVEVEGASKFYIVAAVILGGETVDAARAALEPIRQARFQTGPMKSRTLGSKRAAWLQLAMSLAAVPFRFYGLVVDKRAIDRNGGLQWKQSFYKFLCGRVYGKLMRAYPALHVRADDYGDEEFKESFGRYIKENHRPTLFDRGTFEFRSAKDDVLVQLADILCGLLARCYDPDRQLSHPEELLLPLRQHALLLDEWPPRFRVTTAQDELVVTLERDGRIASYSLSLAEKFLVDHESTIDPDTQCRIAVVERLLFERRFGEEHASVQADELMTNLQERGLDPKGARWFRTAVMAGLRDQGILVTSSSAGYKLPVSVSDLVNYARQAENTCVPMLNRVQAACEAVKLLTKGEVDVLARREMEIVHDLLDVLSRRGTRQPGPEGDV
jgi:Protein of unknown function (DUF3800)